MAITSGNSSQTTACGNLSWSHNNNMSSDSILVVCANVNQGNTTPLNIKYNNISLTIAAARMDFGSACAVIAYLVNPPVGNYTITVNGNSMGWSMGSAKSFGGVNQASPIGTTGVNATSATSISHNFTPQSASSRMIFSTRGYSDPLSLTSPSGVSGIANQSVNCSSITLRGRSDFWDVDTVAQKTLSYTYGSSGNGKALALAELKAAPEVPVIASNPTVDSIFGTSATGHANITDDQGHTITERGWVADTSTAPTTSDLKFTTAGTTGEYDTTMTGLLPLTHYYARPFATNSEGTTYGDEVEFDTVSDFAPHVVGSLAAAIGIIL